MFIQEMDLRELNWYKILAIKIENIQAIKLFASIELIIKIHK